MGNYPEYMGASLWPRLIWWQFKNGKLAPMPVPWPDDFFYAWDRSLGVWVVYR